MTCARGGGRRGQPRAPTCAADTSQPPLRPPPPAPQGPYIANKRSPRIREQYSQIGGKSPIGDWTRLQGQRLEDELNAVVSAAKAAPTPTPASAASTSPAFKHYVAFRYAPPLTEETLLAMAADGVTRCVDHRGHHKGCARVSHAPS